MKKINCCSFGSGYTRSAGLRKGLEYIPPHGLEIEKNTPYIKIYRIWTFEAKKEDYTEIFTWNISSLENKSRKKIVLLSNCTV